MYFHGKGPLAEMQHSGEFLKEQFNSQPEVESAEKITRLAPDKLAVSLIEGWRGEICHVALTTQRDVSADTKF
jgi:hypothetical protein